MHAIRCADLEWVAHAWAKLDEFGKLHGKRLIRCLLVPDLDGTGCYIFQYKLLSVLGARQPVSPFQLLCAVHPKPASTSQPSSVNVGEQHHRQGGYGISNMPLTTSACVISWCLHLKYRHSILDMPPFMIHQLTSSSSAHGRGWHHNVQEWSCLQSVAPGPPLPLQLRLDGWQYIAIF